MPNFPTHDMRINPARVTGVLCPLVCLAADFDVRTRRFKLFSPSLGLTRSVEDLEDQLTIEFGPREKPISSIRMVYRVLSVFFSFYRSETCRYPF